MTTDRLMFVWDAETGAEIQRFPAAPSGSLVGLVSPDGRYALCGGWNGETRMGDLRLFDFATGGLKRSYSGHEGYVWNAAFSPDSRRIVSGGHRGAVHVWDTASREQIHQLTAGNAFVKAVAFSRDSRLVAAAQGGGIYLWNAETGEQIARHVSQPEITCLTFSLDDRHLYSVGSAPLCLWDVH